MHLSKFRQYFNSATSLQIIGLSAFLFGSSLFSSDAFAHESCSDWIAPTSQSISSTSSTLNSSEAAQWITNLPRLTDYALVEVKISKEIKVRLQVNGSAPWLEHAFEKFLGHSIDTATQNDVRGFLDSLSKSDLAALVSKEPEMYHGDVQAVVRDQKIYTLSEWILSQKRQDLSLALIGQSLFERFVKKESRIVLTERIAPLPPSFSLLVQNRNPELLTPGHYLSGDPQAQLLKNPSAVQVEPLPALQDPKKPQSFTLIDEQGRKHDIRVINRSAVEKIAKTERDQIIQASDEDLVPVEFYLLPGYLPGGTTTFRFGDSMFHYGSGGWDHPPGSEGVKRYLINDPWSRRMYLSHRGLELPPYNIGVKILVKKKQIEELKRALEAEFALPDSEKCAFSFSHNNCVHNPSRLFESVGIPLAQGKLYHDFSSTLFIRNLFLNSAYPVQSVNVYPFAGNELSVSELRARFPSFLTRPYTVATDRKLSRISSQFRWQYHLAVFLEAVKRAGDHGRPAVEDSLKRMLIAETPEQFQFYLKGAVDEGFVHPQTLQMTERGESAYREYQKQFNLDDAILRD